MRIVVKLGSSSLTYPTGLLNLGRIETLVRELADISNAGHEVCLVTSGAQAAGMGKLGLPAKPSGMPERQAIAAIGQGLLMQIYEKLFSEYGKVIAQILLTREDLKDRRRYINARNAMGSLFGYNVIPVINENDTVAVDEIKFGDNDTLSALVANLIDADLLVILSDIEGLYTADPHKDSEAALISEVPSITADIEALAGSPGSSLGTGGMFTKIQAAKIATATGISMVIASSSEHDVLRRIIEGEKIGTIFRPKKKRAVSRKRWLVFSRPIKGSVSVDQGAASALATKGTSLLPSGVVAVGGDFMPGDVVAVIGSDGNEIARGVTGYSSAELHRIKGCQTAEIENILGYKRADEVVHRDNLLCL